MAVKTKTINIDEYPELTLLSWNRAVREITGEDALALYERCWRYLDPRLLNEKEIDLLVLLATEYGNGILNVPTEGLPLRLLPFTFVRTKLFRWPRDC